MALFSSKPYFSSSLKSILPDIRRLAKSHRFSEIESLLEPLKQNLPIEISSREPYLASFISSYASVGMLDQSIRTFEQLPLLNSPRTTLSFNALLSACVHSKTLIPRVPILFSTLSQSHSLPPDNVSYGILIKSLCLARDTSKALLLLREMEEKKVEVTVVSYTTVMDSLYKEGRKDEAEGIWIQMREKGVFLDVGAYNVRVMYFAANGQLEDVLGVIEEIREGGLEPDVFTFNYLIACYCRNGRFDDAKRVYGEIREKGCRPNVAMYKNLLYALCKNGDFVGGIEVFEDSVKERRVPDLGSVMMLVKGLMKGSRVRAAKRIVSGLKKKFPEDFVGGWKKLEDVVGLRNDEKVVEVES